MWSGQGAGAAEEPRKQDERCVLSGPAQRSWRITGFPLPANMVLQSTWSVLHAGTAVFVAQTALNWQDQAMEGTKRAGAAFVAASLVVVAAVTLVEHCQRPVELTYWEDVTG